MKAAIETHPEHARSFVIPLNVHSIDVLVAHPGLSRRSQLVPRGVVDELVQRGLLRRVEPWNNRNWRHELTPAGYGHRPPRSLARRLSRASSAVRWLAAFVAAVIIFLAALATILTFVGQGR
jgi:hypothetical protein